MRTKFFIKYWLPVVLCMALIFSGSGDTRSWQHSSRIIAPIIHWLLPHLDEESVKRIVMVVRKCAHLAEFALLCLLVWRALRHTNASPAKPWCWSEARLALALTVLYAATDELHQTFVPFRDGAVRDVLVDACGAGAGLLVLWAVGRWRKWW